MSYSLRNRTVAYDNIAVASATGRENTILGTSGAYVKSPAHTTDFGGLDNVASGTTDIGIENGTVGGDPATENVDTTSNTTT
jgi:hypothetical protein